MKCDIVARRHHRGAAVHAVDPRTLERFDENEPAPPYLDDLIARAAEAVTELCRRTQDDARIDGWRTLARELRAHTPQRKARR